MARIFMKFYAQHEIFCLHLSNLSRLMASFRVSIYSVRMLFAFLSEQSLIRSILKALSNIRTYKNRIYMSFSIKFEGEKAINLHNLCHSCGSTKNV